MLGGGLEGEGEIISIVRVCVADNEQVGETVVSDVL